MQVIASIPFLRGAVDGDLVRPFPAAAVAEPVAETGGGPAATEPAVADDEAAPASATRKHRLRRTVGKRRGGVVLLSPSIVALAALSAAVWAAAWRNERLRAIEQRPQRVAMEPPASAGPGRSLMP